MKRVILSGGGTGGHIYPAITIAKELQKEEDVEILFVGTPNGMESQIIPKEGFNFVGLPAAGLQRHLTIKNIANLLKSLLGFVKAFRIIREFKPDVVIGTGGYVCGPILLMSALLNIPTIIQEQNVIPGVTNRILGRFVKKIALGYEEAKENFAHPEKCIYTGNPIRSDIVQASREESRKNLGISNETFMVLITGGSRGAHSINQAMVGVHEYFKSSKNICLYHITGDKEYSTIMKSMSYNPDVSKIIRYEYNMPQAMAAADLIICRAGAISLAELAARELPSILIPYPYAAEDHQTFNARVFVSAGAAKMIVDKYLTAKELIQDIELLNQNTKEVEAMSMAAKRLGRVQAGKDIAKLALSLAK